MFLLTHSVSGKDFKDSLFQATGIMSHPIPLLIADHILGKKGISDSFETQILRRILPVACIFSCTIMTYLKKLTGIKFL